MSTSGTPVTLTAGTAPPRQNVTSTSGTPARPFSAVEFKYPRNRSHRGLRDMKTDFFGIIAGRDSHVLVEEKRVHPRHSRSVNFSNGRRGVGRVSGTIARTNDGERRQAGLAGLQVGAVNRNEVEILIGRAAWNSHTENAPS